MTDPDNKPISGSFHLSDSDYIVRFTYGKAEIRLGESVEVMIIGLPKSTYEISAELYSSTIYADETNGITIDADSYHIDNDHEAVCVLDTVDIEAVVTTAVYVLNHNPGVITSFTTTQKEELFRGVEMVIKKGDMYYTGDIEIQTADTKYPTTKTISCVTKPDSTSSRYNIPTYEFGVPINGKVYVRNLPVGMDV